VDDYGSQDKAALAVLGVCAPPRDCRWVRIRKDLEQPFGHRGRRARMDRGAR
jgi:hypothetical protein